MKKITFLLILIFGFSLTLFTQENDKNWINKVVGLYSGEIGSSTSTLPGLTNFYMSIDGNLKGEYEITDGSTTVSGILTNFKLIEPFKAKFEWKDSYGTGDLVIVFNKDLTGFTGFWTVRGNNKQYLWNGFK